MEIEDLVLAPTRKRWLIRAIKNLFALLTIVTNTSVLDATGFRDLLLVIEKIDLSLCCDLGCLIAKEMIQILNVILAKFIHTGFKCTVVDSCSVKTAKG